MKLPIPKALERRLAPLVERGNQFLRTWEWTWTTAVVASPSMRIPKLLQPSPTTETSSEPIFLVSMAPY